MKGLFTPKQKSALFLVIGYAMASGVCDKIGKDTIAEIIKKLDEQEIATP